MRFYHLFLVIVATFLLACTPADSTDTPIPASVTPEQFKQFSWIEGQWRGSEAEGEPFFESYHMIDDSTVVGRTWSDNTFSTVTDSSRIQLRNSEVTSGSSVVTQWNNTSMHFEPRDKSGNTFTWSKESAAQWTAKLYWKDKSGAPQGRTYIMKRVVE